MKYFLILLGSYLLGSVPVGYLVGKWRGVDIRQIGSGNIGATNAARAMGTWAFFAVLLGDAAKGIISVLIAKWVGDPNFALLAAIAAIAGHNWSLFLGFKGGRGVATGAGVLLVLAPPVLGIAALIWIVTVLLTRYVSLGSVLAASSIPLFMLIFKKTWTYVVFGFAAGAFVVYRHVPNIKRLFAGTENKLGNRLK